MSANIKEQRANGTQVIVGPHPNGTPGGIPLRRPKRDDEPFMADIFPKTPMGELLRGIHRSFLIKHEPRIGWARKRACQEQHLLAYPCESVAAHQWGVKFLVFVISSTQEFQTESPNFDKQAAYEMASIHDLPELVTGDIVPPDNVSAQEKRRRESQAMQSILSFYPAEVQSKLEQTYHRYEARQCNESKFVKDCDRLDFIIQAFVYERQGFSGFDEFYTNSRKDEFSTKVAKELAELLVKVRDQLNEQNSLYSKIE